MYLPLGQYSPNVKIGFVSASRNCFPRELAEKRAKKLIAQAKKLKVNLTVPKGSCWIIETRAHAAQAAKKLKSAGCQGAVLFLGNFSPEIEDAQFVKEFPGKTRVIAAQEESASTLLKGRGDALCGLLSATLAIHKRGLDKRVYVPEQPLVTAENGAKAIRHFQKILKVTEGISNATIGLFGPRPRDFESCNYNTGSLVSLGVEIEELGHFDLANSVEKLKKTEGTQILRAMKKELKKTPDDDFMTRLALYEKAILKFRDQLKLSGAATQCWVEQEFRLKHVPCYINARMAAKGFPVACENDAYSLVSELMGQYASDGDATILDLNHTIPADLGKAIKGLKV
jgi:L-fucose isomerase-like protein